MADLPLSDGFVATPGRYLWHAESATAILSDLHIGIEKSMARQGINFPPVNDRAIRSAWEELQSRRPARVVIAGDLFDAPVPDDQTVQVVRNLLATRPSTISVTIIPGNHDPELAVLREVFHNNSITVVPAVRVGPEEGYTVIHGHCWLDLDDAPPTKGIIVGHQHPAVVLRDRIQAVKMICFAATTATVAGKPLPLLLLPTFSTAPLGTNLLSQGKWIVDCPPPPAARVRIAGIVKDRVLDFGTLANLPHA